MRRDAGMADNRDVAWRRREKGSSKRCCGTMAKKYATSRGVMRFGDGSSARQGKVRKPRTSSQGKVSQAKAARDAHPSQVKVVLGLLGGGVLRCLGGRVVLR